LKGGTIAHLVSRENNWMKDERDDKVKPEVKQDATPRHRFALIVWLAIYPMVTLANYLFEDLMKGWEIYQKTLLISLIEVPLAVYIFIPLLQRFFGNWLKFGNGK
jgi:antibiotic biosynthesis monooxygenase (ABM) superfamily enzyme